MFFKFIAAAAIVATPVLAHAQSTTPTVPQDTTSRTRIHTDSTTIDTANGSVYTTRKKTDKKVDSTKVHTDTTMNASPIDSTKMGVPPARPTPTPPTE
jgi:hypothetical protein